MTPQEKAKDLFVKMMEYTPDSVIQDNMDAKEICKVHALICLDEIISAIDNFGYSDTWYDNFETGHMVNGNLLDPTKYWQEVKQEIQAL